MRGECRLFQVCIGFYELTAGNAENCGGVLPRPAVEGFCHRPSLPLLLFMEGKNPKARLFFVPLSVFHYHCTCCVQLKQKSFYC